MGKIKTFFLILISVAFIGAVATFIQEKDAFGFSRDIGPSADDIAKLSVDTDVITTNLASNNFAIVQFNILLNSKDAKEELVKRSPEIRAAIISTVAGFTKEQLVGKEGIANLEKELFVKVKPIVENGRVERVLVTEFKVQ
jgi:flagellar protein FliL